MKTIEPLYNFIHSLNKSEKRSFKLFLSKYSLKKDSNVTTMYNILSASSIYNPSLFEQKLRAEGLIDNLAYEKHRLQTILLDFLVDYHKNNSLELQLNKMLMQIDLLNNKKQFEFAQKLLEKAIKLASEVQDPFYLNQLYVYKANMLITHFSSEKEALEDTLQKAEQTAQDILTETKYESLNRRFHMLHAPTSHENEEKIKELTQSEYFVDESKATTIRSKICLYSAKALYYRTKEDLDNLLKYEEKHKRVFDEHPSYIEHKPNNYFSAYFNHIIALLAKHKFDECLNLLEEAETFPEKMKRFLRKEHRSFFNDCFYTLKMETLLHLFKIKEIYQLVNDQDIDIEACYAHNQIHRSDFYFYACLSSLVMEDYEGVIKWLKKCEQNVDINYLIHNYLPAKVAGIIAEYERGNGLSIKSDFDAFYYLSRKNNWDHGYYKCLSSVLRKLTQNPTLPELQKTIKTALKENDQDEDYSYRGRVFFECWMEAKLKNKTLKEIIDLQVSKGTKGNNTKIIQLPLPQDQPPQAKSS